jgi:hypothetical protein
MKISPPFFMPLHLCPQYLILLNLATPATASILYNIMNPSKRINRSGARNELKLLEVPTCDKALWVQISGITVLPPRT